MGKWIWYLVVAAMATVAVADDWSAWRGPNADGISAETGLNPKGASKLWNKELGPGYSSVSVKNGKLYTMGHTNGMDIVYCLDAKTGKEIWNHDYACKTGKFKGPRATPVVDGKNLYTVSREGLVICFDAASGNVNWKTDVLEETGNENIRWGLSSSAVVEGNLLLLNIGDAGVALDKNSGRVEWKSKGQPSYATPVVFDFKGKRLAAIFSTPGLQIVEARTGKKIADFEWKTKYDINGADPMVIGDRIFISSGYDRECAMLDFSSGKLKKLWSNDLLKNQFSSSIHVDGHIYGVDGQTKKKGFLRCIDAKDGSDVWKMPIGFGSLIAADGMLIALGEKGTLYFAELSPKGYNEISQMETGLTRLCWTPPVLANGIVYCRNDKGTLVAVDVR
ncbi:MAG: PQQ-binding-like beta-propeller repeat protein [Verrucomicrobiota bacterium]|nr:PQQ-binding-like beta-propeller repeat protein [Verrucomicrobiota bacterium]